MMRTLLRAWLIELKRDRVALAMTFLLPILFFTVFGMIFRGATGGTVDPVRIAIVDEDGSEASRRLVAALKKDGSLTVTMSRDEKNPAPLDRAGALAMVKAGKPSIALVIPSGFGKNFGSFMGGPAGGGGTEVILLADMADKVAPQMVAGLLQGAAMTSAPDLMMEHGLEMFEKYGGAMTPSQRAAMEKWLPELKRVTEEQAKETKSASPGHASPNSAAPAAGRAADEKPGFRGPVSVKVVDVLGEQKTQAGRNVALSASQTATMFLLFMASAAAGTLLEEEENGVLERLLGTRLTMGRLLRYKWLYLMMIGIVQVSVMFVWGTLLGLELWKHLPGFLAMTVFTSAAGAALGLVLATACRTRAQLGGISTIVILTMSAIGGSMVPRQFMPAAMQQAGWLTFNAWALEGYQKVFWREMGVVELWPELLVLAGATVVLLAVARRLARRWETV